MPYKSGVLRMRVSDGWICFSSMAKATSQSRKIQIVLKKTERAQKEPYRQNQRKAGTWMEQSLALSYAREFGCLEEAKELLAGNCARLVNASIEYVQMAHRRECSMDVMLRILQCSSTITPTTTNLHRSYQGAKIPLCLFRKKGSMRMGIKEADKC